MEVLIGAVGISMLVILLVIVLTTVILVAIARWLFTSVKNLFKRKSR